MLNNKGMPLGWRTKRLMLIGSGSTTLAMTAIGAVPAAAQCVTAPNSVTCGTAGSPYPDGIQADAVGDLDVVLRPGVRVATNASDLVGVKLTTTGNLTVNAVDDVVIATVGGDGEANAAGVATSSGGSTALAIDVVQTSAAASPAVEVRSGADTLVTANRLSTAGERSNGLDIVGAGSVDFTVGEVNTTGAGSTGVRVSSSGSISGSIATLTMEGNSISTEGGTDEEGNANPPVLTGGVGVQLSSEGDDINLSLGALRNLADRAGVSAASSGGGVSVSVTGNVETRGAALDLTALSVAYIPDPADANADPTVQVLPGAGDPAIRGRAIVNVAAGATLKGIENPAIRTNATIGTTITNAGRIERSSWPGESAIEVSGGAATIENSGTIIGRMRLTGSADVVNNAGVYAFLDGTNFDNDGDGAPGAIPNLGKDVFNNSGTVKLVNFQLARGEPNAGKDVLFGQMDNLEVFNNSGLIDLRSGAAGDEFKITRTAVSVTNGSLIPQSDYNGLGNATLAVDLEFSATAAMVDRLNVQNATGSTKVLVNVIGGADPNILVSLPVIYVADGSTAKFELSPLQVGDVSYALRYNPTINAFALYGSVPDSLIRLTKLPGNAQTLWYRSNDMVSAHLRQERDRRWSDAEPRSRLWFQLGGDVTSRRETYAETVNYVPVAGFDLTQRQQTYLGLAGFDSKGPENGENGVIIGASVGYGKNTTRFRSASDRYEVDQLGVGAHVSWLAGSFYLTGTANYARHGLRLSNASSRLLVDKTSGKSLGAALEGGFRLGSDVFFVEPSAGFTYVVTKIDGMALRKGRFAFDEFTGNLGTAGIRLGGRKEWGDRAIVYYAGAQAVHEYAGNDYADVAIGGPSVDIPIRAPGTFGKATAGVNLVTDTRVNLFAEANGYFGGALSGGGGKVGLRVGF